MKYQPEAISPGTGQPRCRKVSAEISPLAISTSQSQMTPSCSALTKPAATRMKIRIPIRANYYTDSDDRQRAVEA